MEIKEIVEEIKKLTLVQVSELVKALEEEFGVSAAAPVADAAAPAAGAEAAPAAAEKSEFDVVLTGFNADRKAETIRAIKEITGLGLLEAKAVVDGCPKTIKEKASADDAKAIKEKLEAIEAKVELK